MYSHISRSFIRPAERRALNKRLDKTTKEFDMFQEYWKIIQRFYTPEETDEYWAELNKTLNGFSEKYGKFAYDLAIAFLDEQDRKIKGRKPE